MTAIYLSLTVHCCNCYHVIMWLFINLYFH